MRIIRWRRREIKKEKTLVCGWECTINKREKKKEICLCF